MAVTVYTAFGYTTKLSVWAELSGIPRATLYSRLRAGMTMEDALTVPYSKGFRWKRYEHDGESLTSSEWAERLGISRQTFLKRIYSGAPPERVFSPGDNRGGKEKSAGQKKRLHGAFTAANDGQTAADTPDATKRGPYWRNTSDRDKIVGLIEEVVKQGNFAKLGQSDERRTNGETFEL
jgi:hypothetical protein